MPFSQSGTKLQMFFQVSGEPVGFFLPNPPYHFYFPPASSSPTRATARTYAGHTFSTCAGQEFALVGGKLTLRLLARLGIFFTYTLGNPISQTAGCTYAKIKSGQCKGGWYFWRKQASYRQCHEGWKLWWCNHKYRMRHLGFRWSYNINIFSCL